MSTFKQATAYARRAAMTTGISAVIQVDKDHYKSVSTENVINNILSSDRDSVKLIITAKAVEKDGNPHYYSYDYQFKEHNVDTALEKEIPDVVQEMLAS